MALGIDSLDFGNDRFRLYDWRYFFKAVADKLSEIGKLEAEARNEQMEQISRAVFGDDALILKLNSIDPFSFIYTLASKNPNKTENWKKSYKKALKGMKQSGFSLPSEFLPPTDNIYPTPLPVNPLFPSLKTQDPHAPKLLWELFQEAIKADSDWRKAGNKIDLYFQRCLDIDGVAKNNLSQALFLINPDQFLPVDNATFTLPIPYLREIEQSVGNKLEKGALSYSQILDKVYQYFPGCKPYEINLFSFTLSQDEKLRSNIGRSCFQISSRPYGDNINQDYWDWDSIDDYRKSDNFDEQGFRKIEPEEWAFDQSSSVWTGWAGNPETGGHPYPLTDPVLGDIILARAGGDGRGIGMVVKNLYRDRYHKWDENGRIYVVWINKTTANQLGNWRNMIAMSRAIDIQKTFSQTEAYRPTFELLGYLNLKYHQERDEQSKQAEQAEQTMESDPYKNIILSGPPGTGKTRRAKQLAIKMCQQYENGEPAKKGLLDLHSSPEIDTIDPDETEKYEGQIELLQFHPSYSYEDFVRGIVAKTTEDGNVSYEVQNKHLMNIVEEAKKYPGKPYILIIDEINRANLPAVLGELIYALEYRGQDVKSLYPKGDDGGQISIPQNLYIIGTMNTADRSTGPIDYAIRRRFAFIPMLAQEEVVSKEASDPYRKLYEKVDKIVKEHKSTELDDYKDIMVGHSYFLPKGNATLEDRWTYEIKPLLEEYIKDGLLKKEGAKYEIDKIKIERDELK